MFGETVNHGSEDPHEMVMDAEQMRQQRFTITAETLKWTFILNSMGFIWGTGLTLKGWLIINPFLWETYHCEWILTYIHQILYTSSILNGKYDVFSLDVPNLNTWINELNDTKTWTQSSVNFFLFVYIEFFFNLITKTFKVYFF